MKKLKVVWLCTFVNDEIALILGVQPKPMFAPWITELIDLFRLRDDIEIHIVVPNYYDNSEKNIYVDKIHVHLFKFMHRFMPFKAHNLSYNYSTTRRSVKKIVNAIKPDIIQLYGSENAHYSAGILELMSRYPVLVTVQGFVHLSTVPKRLISRYVRWNRIRIESKINQNAKFMSCGTRDSLAILNKINPTATKYSYVFPTTAPKVSADDFPQKKFDIVYFARIAADKGIEDLIEAVKLIKVGNKDIRVIVIGGGNPEYVQSIQNKIIKYQLSDNIEFAGFQPTQQDVFKLAARARVYVLPTHFDGIPGSIREAMMMKIPVVAYAVGGIPTFNDVKECVTLVEKRNITELAEKIEMVLNNTVRTKQIVNNAFEMMADKFDNSKIGNNLIGIYQDIFNKYVDGKEN